MVDRNKNNNNNDNNSNNNNNNNNNFAFFFRAFFNFCRPSDITRWCDFTQLTSNRIQSHNLRKIAEFVDKMLNSKKSKQ